MNRNRPNPVKRQASTIQVKIPEHVIGDLSDSFSYFDPKKTGMIGLHQLSAILQNFTMKNATRKEIEDEIYAVCESDKADWNDLLTIVGKKYKQTGSESEIRDLWTIFDKRDRGYSNPGELRQILSTHLAVPPSEQEITELIESINIDSTGNIRFSDFKRLMESF
jgi:Ca2+-binding EF-hand superfamily protein